MKHIDCKSYKFYYKIIDGCFVIANDYGRIIYKSKY